MSGQLTCRGKCDISYGESKYESNSQELGANAVSINMDKIYVGEASRFLDE